VIPNKLLKSKQITILGKGQAGGKQIYFYFQKLGLNPTFIDSKTKNPDEITLQADIIISAVGKPDTLTNEKIKKGAIIIGIGISRSETGKLRGDFDEEDIASKANIYTPTPGGIGPVNVAMLMKNLIIATEK
jgi:methylenetetrahydrofolate dehydrogenase (NADP+)/methenyltetrahydrofolate cyclohydrolase